MSLSRSVFADELAAPLEPIKDWFPICKIKRFTFSEELLMQQFFRHTYEMQPYLHWRLATAKRTIENPSPSHNGKVIIAKITCLNDGLA